MDECDATIARIEQRRRDFAREMQAMMERSDRQAEAIERAWEAHDRGDSAALNSMRAQMGLHSEPPKHPQPVAVARGWVRRLFKWDRPA